MFVLTITPDLKQNIVYTVSLTILHNLPAILFFCGILFAIVLSVIKPTRKSVFLLVGFSLLLVAFEFQKHILDNLREQTLNSLITIQEHNKVRWIINVLTLKIVPFVLPLVGWVCTLGSTLAYLREYLARKKRSRLLSIPPK